MLPLFVSQLMYFIHNPKSHRFMLSMLPPFSIAPFSSRNLHALQPLRLSLPSPCIPLYESLNMGMHPKQQQASKSDSKLQKILRKISIILAI